MNRPSSHQFLLMGLPSTGKTSFLAALWYMVNQPDIECALSIEQLDGDSKYLNLISDAWLQYKAVPRNPLDSEKLVSMILKRRHGTERLQVTFPDLSGESFRLQWTARQFTTQYDSRLQESGGAILFVHPMTLTKPHRIDTLIRTTQNVQGAEPEESGPDQSVPSSLVPWDSEQAPTQVQLVELLQFIAARDYFRPPFRLAILVSAWDLVSYSGEDPQDWISRQMPLLRQFLDCNSDVFDVAFYGVSAQGGRYVSSLFIAENFLEPALLSQTLQQGATPLAEWLWAQMDTAMKSKILDNLGDPAGLQAALALGLNGIVSKADIYEKALFEGILLREDTRDLIQERHTQISDDHIRLNRLLLEDAFPLELARTRQFAQDAAELQTKPPSHRVALVGSNVSNEHDITEPLQWLIR
jgi:hypothetical protein